MKTVSVAINLDQNDPEYKELKNNAEFLYQKLKNFAKTIHWIDGKENEEEENEEGQTKKKLDELRSELKITQEEVRNQRTYNKLITTLAKLSGTSDFIKNNPDIRDEIEERVLEKFYINPKKSLESIFEDIVKQEKTKQDKVVAQYITRKKQDADETKTGKSSSGGTLIKTEDFKATPEDVRSGKVLSMLKQRLLGEQ